MCNVGEFSAFCNVCVVFLLCLLFFLFAEYQYFVTKSWWKHHANADGDQCGVSLSRATWNQSAIVIWLSIQTKKWLITRIQVSVNVLWLTITIHLNVHILAQGWMCYDAFNGILIEIRKNRKYIVWDLPNALCIM